MAREWVAIAWHAAAAGVKGDTHRGLGAVSTHKATEFVVKVTLICVEMPCRFFWC
jgi:hypothetical protein